MDTKEIVASIEECDNIADLTLIRGEADDRIRRLRSARDRDRDTKGYVANPVDIEANPGTRKQK